MATRSTRARAGFSNTSRLQDFECCLFHKILDAPVNSCAPCQNSRQTSSGLLPPMHSFKNRSSIRAGILRVQILSRHLIYLSDAMKRCNICKTFSPTESTFCPTCRSTFGRALCPYLHPNPSTAEFCTICGSRMPRPPAHLTGRHGRVVATVIVSILLIVILALAIRIAVTTFQSSPLTASVLHTVGTTVLPVLQYLFSQLW